MRNPMSIETTELKSSTPNADEKGDRPQIIEVVNNRIYFYSPISQEPILKLNKAIRETSNDLLSKNAIYDAKEGIELFLHIYSFGGSIISGLSAMDEIINCKIPITTVVDGACASAATFLSIVGERRLMKKNNKNMDTNILT